MMEFLALIKKVLSDIFLLFYFWSQKESILDTRKNVFYFTSKALFILEISRFKGNPNSQGILNWIIQILHYYYSKQHKNIENSQIIEQNLVIFLSLSVLLSVDYGLRFLRLPNSRVFSVLKRHKWSFVKYIIPFFGLKMVFSKLSLAIYHFLHK